MPAFFLSPRFRAATLHFLISLAIFLALVIFLLLIWYPSPYFTASGGWHGLRLVAMVDLVLGPLLTLFVWNPGKSRRELILDMSLIAAIQVSVLIWGVIQIYQQRPVAVVFWDNSFYTVPAAAVSAEDLESISELPRSVRGPHFAFVPRPRSPWEHQSMLRAVIEDGIPPHEQVGRYQPMQENFAEIGSAGIDIHEIVETNASMNRALRKTLSNLSASMEDFLYIPLVSRYRNIILIFDHSGNLRGTLMAPYKTGEV
jgi:hypothetical protein